MTHYLENNFEEVMTSRFIDINNFSVKDVLFCVMDGRSSNRVIFLTDHVHIAQHVCDCGFDNIIIPLHNPVNFTEQARQHISNYRREFSYDDLLYLPKEEHKIVLKPNSDKRLNLMFQKGQMFEYLYNLLTNVYRQGMTFSFIDNINIMKYVECVNFDETKPKHFFPFVHAQANAMGVQPSLVIGDIMRDYNMSVNDIARIDAFRLRFCNYITKAESFEKLNDVYDKLMIEALRNAEL